MLIAACSHLAGSLKYIDLINACGAQEIAGLVLKEQSPKRLFEVRGKLYELLVNCIPPELILRRMALELLPRLDDELKHKLVEQAAFFEHRLQARARLRLLACPACHGLVGMRVRTQRSTASLVCN